MSKYFRTSIDWVKKLGCEGVVINTLREQPKQEITKEGGVYRLNTCPVVVNPYKKMSEKSRAIEINVFMPIQDMTDRIGMEPLVVEMVNCAVKESLKRDMTEVEESQLKNMFSDAF